MTEEQQLVGKEEITEQVPVQEPVAEKEEEFTFDMTMKKKKKKKKAEEAVEGEKDDEASATGDAKVPEAAMGAAYTYQELLARAFRLLREHNPDLDGERKKFTIVPPIIGREGSKKTAFTNIADLSRRMRRPVEHVTSFILTELGTTGSVDANERLIIKGRFQQIQMENVLRRYIGEYVTCKTCRSPETQLTKENRLFFIKCESCESSRSVATIRAGFKAQTGRRVRTG